MIPSCDQTGVLHFHSSVTSGSACLISARSRASSSPRQSPSSAILVSMSSDAEPALFATAGFLVDDFAELRAFAADAAERMGCGLDVGMVANTVPDCQSGSEGRAQERRSTLTRRHIEVPSPRYTSRRASSDV